MKYIFVRLVSSHLVTFRIVFYTIVHSMNIRVGINGFGRIGRSAARVILGGNTLTLAAINSTSDASSHAYLLHHDSTQGAFDRQISVKDSTLVVDRETIECFNEKEPQNIPWKKANVDIVLECTGKFRTTEDAAKHLEMGASHVIISAPARDATPTLIMGVNHKMYHGQTVVSNSSCTTNCVTTVLKILDDEFSVSHGSMTTIHAVTDSQNLLDNSHKKEVRMRRSAMANMIPTSSGSAKDVGKIFPHLFGKLPCRSVRVPLASVSLIELVVVVKKSVTPETVNAAFHKATENPQMKGILGVATEELVSTDFVGDPRSAIVDPYLTDVVDGTMIHVTAWYDNEWGYANRLVELADYMTKNG